MDSEYIISIAEISKRLMLEQMVDEGYITDQERDELDDRCHIIVYKEKWYEAWFKRRDPESKLDGTRLRLVEFQTKSIDNDNVRILQQ